MANLTREQVQQLYNKQGAKTSEQKVQIVDYLRKKGHTVGGYGVEANKQVQDFMKGQPKNIGEASMQAVQGLAQDVAGTAMSAVTTPAKAITGGAGDILQTINPLSSADIGQRFQSAVKGTKRVLTSPIGAVTGPLAGKEPIDFAQQAGEITGKSFSSGIGKVAQGLYEYPEALMTGEAPEKLFGKVIPGIQQAVFSPAAGVIGSSRPEVQNAVGTVGNMFTAAPEAIIRSQGIDPNSEQGVALKEALSIVQEGLMAGASYGLSKTKPVQYMGGKIRESASQGLPTLQKGIDKADEAIQGVKTGAKKITAPIRKKFEPISTRFTNVDDLARKAKTAPSARTVRNISQKTGMSTKDVKTVTNSANDPTLFKQQRKMYNQAKQNVGSTSSKMVPHKTVAAQPIVKALDEVQNVRKKAGSKLDDIIMANKDKVVNVQGVKSQFDDLLSKYKVKRKKGKLQFIGSIAEDSPDLQKALSSIDSKIKRIKGDTTTIGTLDTSRKALFQLQDDMSKASAKGLTKQAKKSIESMRKAMSDAIDIDDYQKAAKQYAISTSAYDDIKKYLGKEAIDEDLLKLRTSEVASRMLGNARARPLSELKKFKEALKQLGIDVDIEQVQELVGFSDFLEKKIFPATQTRSLRGEVSAAIPTKTGLLTKGAEKVAEKVMGTGVQQTKNFLEAYFKKQKNSKLPTLKK